MDKLAIIKALSNEMRLQIMEWLKAPEASFDFRTPYVESQGVCCGAIQRKAGMSQSTISHYLSQLERCGLLTSKREGQWTFYRRNEAVIREFTQMMQKAL